MKILVVSYDGVGALPIANRLQREGHDVSWFSYESGNIGNGIVEKLFSWRAGFGTIDLLVCVGPNLQGVISVAQGMGKPIIGGALVPTQGVETAQQAFVTQEQVAEVIEKWPEKGLFISSQGAKWPQDYWACTTPEEYLYVIQHKHRNKEHIVQELQQGELVSVVGWWNGRKWLKPFHMHWRADPMRAFSSGMVYTLNNEELLESTIIPLKEALKLSTYRGPVFVDCILAPSGNVHIMNIDMSIRPDYLELLAEGAYQDMATLLFETATGTALNIRNHKEYALGDVLEADDVAGAPVVGLNQQNLKHISLVSVRADAVYTYIEKAFSSILMVTARGETVREAGKRVARSISNLHILRVNHADRFRLDLAAERHLARLLKWRHI